MRLFSALHAALFLGRVLAQDPTASTRELDLKSAEAVDTTPRPSISLLERYFSCETLGTIFDWVSVGSEGAVYGTTAGLSVHLACQLRGGAHCKLVGTAVGVGFAGSFVTLERSGFIRHAARKSGDVSSALDPTAGASATSVTGVATATRPMTPQ